MIHILCIYGRTIWCEENGDKSSIEDYAMDKLEEIVEEETADIRDTELFLIVIKYFMTHRMIYQQLHEKLTNLHNRFDK